ncbi:hypothetical protein BH10PSE13_BH10PSE13_24840 [soil metagenome]
MSATSDFYLARAAQSQREADETVLDNVRDRCLRAESAWRAMADRLLRSETERQRQVADKAAEATRLEQEGL